jgi:preprotein translocase subunit SecE
MAVISRVREFIKEVQVESTKVSWPTRTELRDATAVVIVTVIIVAAFVYVADSILRAGMSLLFR